MSVTLTPREMQILRLVAEGFHNSEIGRKLGRAEDTVKRHITNIYDKTGMSNRVELTNAFHCHPEWSKEVATEQKHVREWKDIMREELRKVVDEEMSRLLKIGLLNESHVRQSMIRVGMCADQPMEQDAGAFMTTVSGKRVHIFKPQEDEIDICDIGAALSRICRFGGHTRRFYSVAQHCVLVSMQLKENGAEVQMAGLLHDAGEAYMGDMIRPIKRSMSCGFYRAAEMHLIAMIMEKFSVHAWGSHATRNLVRQADDVALATEMRDLMHWSDPDLPPPITDAIWPLDHELALSLFMGRFNELQQRVSEECVIDAASRE